MTPVISDGCNSLRLTNCLLKVTFRFNGPVISDGYNLMRILGAEREIKMLQ